MIEFLSSWAKGLGLTIVVVSILEMLLPNNKTKKYIRAVMGVYVLFTIISPFIKNQNIFDVNNIDLENYISIETSSNTGQTSRDEKIQQLYIDEMQKDITKKLKKKGFEVTTCKVNAQISDDESETKITKIKLKLEKAESTNEGENGKTNAQTSNQNEQGDEQTDSIENKIVTEIQKIKPVNTTVSDSKTSTNSNDATSSTNSKKNTVSKSDIQNVKKFLIEEYEVSEQCLEIN